MKVKQLQLQNYGRFDNLTMEFAPNNDTKGNVTIIVGNNGAGKSQILQALATGFSWFVNGVKDESSGFEIDKKFIKNGLNDTCVNVITNFNQQKISTNWQFMAVKDGRNSSFKNKINELNNIVDNYRKNLTENNLLSLPLIIYYPVERSIIGNSQADILSSEFDQLDAYFACVDGVGIDFYDFFKWFRNEEDIINQKTINVNSELSKDEEYQQYIAIKRDLKDREKIINDNLNSIKEYSSNDNPQIADMLNRFDELKEQFYKYEKFFENLTKMKIALSHLSGIENIGRYSSTIKAIEHFTDFKNIHIERQGTPKMVVEKDGEKLDVNQLSQGEKSLLALVGDIARRLAILNPSLDNPLQGEGVVLIDEVDLHLHPKWQQNLIDKLTKTFPNVQFILTTHSPHIVSDNPDVLVYILDNGELRAYNNAYGEDVNTLLNGVFGVSEFTPEIAEQFTEVRRAIGHKELDKAEKIIQELSDKLSPNNSELLRLQLYLAKAKLTQSKAS